MKSKNKVFLETTIQVDRFSANPEKKKKIEEILSKFENLYTSTYVKMEYKRSLIRHLVYLYNVILYDAKNFAECFFKMQPLPPEQLRKIKGILASFANFFLSLERGDISKSQESSLLEIARSYFKNIIEIAWIDFDKKIDSIFNETECLNAKVGPIFEDGKFYNKISCIQKGKNSCRIVEFFVRHEDSVKKLYNKFIKDESLDIEQKKMLNIIEKALTFPQNMKKDKNCFSCGDLIIALECPKDSLLFTTNTKHFKPLTAELEKDYLPLKVE
jgi:hypothetical protein